MEGTRDLRVLVNQPLITGFFQCLIPFFEAITKHRFFSLFPTCIGYDVIQTFLPLLNPIYFVSVRDTDYVGKMGCFNVIYDPSICFLP